MLSSNSDNRWEWPYKSP